MYDCMRQAKMVLELTAASLTCRHSLAVIPRGLNFLRFDLQRFMTVSMKDMHGLRCRLWPRYRLPLHAGMPLPWRHVRTHISGYSTGASTGSLY